jgi:O-antigen/teichoic acid export membrane protein
MSQAKYYVKSFGWGVISKLTDAALKFITVPLMLHYFGKDSYGILVLAISTNAYMDLLDLGINTGAINYFSQWIDEKRFPLIQSVSRTSMTFYLIIGLVNSFILVLLALFGHHLFHIAEDDFKVLQTMFYTLSIYCIINWGTSVFRQLLIADQQINFIQRIDVIRSIVNFTWIFITIWCKLSLVTYFFFYLLINSVVIIPYYSKAKLQNLILSFIPSNDWKSFRPILMYSLSIFAMGIFQYTATQSRPIVLGIYNTIGPSILTEYRIIEVFPLLIISLGSIIITILLPITSRLVSQNQQDKIAEMAYKGTRITTTLIILLSFPIIISSREILVFYVGAGYKFLAPWLSLWVFTIVMYLHNSPVSSLVLSTGKTRPLVFSSAISCTISIIINAILCQSLGAGSAVVGYFVYILIQMSFYYLYFNTRVLKLRSLEVFKSFMLPTLIAIISAVPAFLINVNLPFIFIIGIKTAVWLVLFVGAMIGFKIFEIGQVLLYFKKQNG